MSSISVIFTTKSNPKKLTLSSLRNSPYFFQWQSKVAAQIAYPFFFSFWVLYRVGFDFVVNITEILLIGR
jgi:hypothetical protein